MRIDRTDFVQRARRPCYVGVVGHGLTVESWSRIRSQICIKSGPKVVPFSVRKTLEDALQTYYPEWPAFLPIAFNSLRFGG